MTDDSPQDDARLGPDRLRSITVASFAGYALSLLLVGGLAFLGLRMESAVRAYVKGESLWSKAQKDAVYALDEYAADGRERYWERYRRAIRVPLAAGRARDELQTADPEMERVRSGFREAGLDGGDIERMTWLLKWFGEWRPIRRSTATWARGDSLIGEVRTEAERIRRAWRKPAPDTLAAGRAALRVDSLSRELTGVAGSFTDSITSAARAVHRWTLWTIGGLVALLLAGGAVAVWIAYRVVRTRERSLRDAEERYRTIFEDAQDAIYVTSRDGEIRALNPAGRRLFGYEEEGALSEVSARDMYHAPSEREHFVEQMEEHGQVQQYEVQFETRDGEVLDCVVNSTARVEDGEIVGYQGVIRDVTERKEFEAELQHRALHDPLTELPNRTLLWDRMEHALSRLSRDETAVAVLFVDLDRFKVINDDLGHAAGDKVLVEASHRLRQSVRSPDTVARVGGDEFVVLLEDLQETSEAELVANRIEQAFEPPFQAGGEEVHLSVSIGLTACSPEELGDTSPEEATDELVRRADDAMFRAKEQPRTRHHWYETRTTELAGGRVQQENELRRAIDEDKLTLRYQPIVEIGTGDTVAVEPLVRWDHPQEGLILPSDFLPLAEESGLIIDLGGWVLEHACRDLRRWTDAALPGEAPLTLHPNLSATQFQDPELPVRVVRILNETGFPPERLQVEVTEHAILQAPEQTYALAEQDVGLCIDDFGTGYSSLSHVRELSVDGLKIDMSFVQGIGKRTTDEAIVRTVVTLGDALDLDVIAEGVEEEGQRLWLERLGCPYAQGYLFQRPVTARELLAGAGEA